MFGAADAQKVVRLLIEVVGGARITVPTLKQIEIEFRDKRIRERFNGFNHSELSMESGLSARHIRRIVNKSNEL
jgi:Mor family transcriptional regulator